MTMVQGTSSTRRGPLLALLAVLLAGFGTLRLASGHYGLWFDEYATLIFADQPAARLWSGWMVRETNPPLFYTMVRAWQGLGLRGVDALRWLPELGGVLGLALLAAAAWLGWGSRAAVPALVLGGLSAQHVHFSQLLRGYVFAADGVTLAFIGLLLVLEAGPDSADRRRRLGWGLYFAGSVAAIYFHTTMVLWPVVATLALPLVARQPRWLLLRAVLVADLAIVLAAGWWLWITFLQVQGHSGNIAWIPRLSPRDYAWTVSQSVLLVREAPGGDHRLSKLVALATVAAVVIALRRPGTRLALACAVLGAGLQGAAAQVQPIATPATLFWLTPFVILLLAGAIGSLRPPLAAGGVLLVLAGVLGLNLVRALHGPAEGDYARALRIAQGQPQAVLLIEHASMGAVTAKACALAYPGRPCPVPIIVLASPLRSNSWATGLGPQPVAPGALPAALGRATGVFTLRSASYDPAVRFGIVGEAAAAAADRPYLEGPFPPRRFAIAAYRPPVPGHP